MDRLLLSSIISHGFMDVFPMNDKINILLLYLVNIYLYYYFLVFNNEIGMMLFYITSCYHFGKDFQIITQDVRSIANWTGPYILGITLDCTDGINKWLTILKKIGFDNNGGTLFINTVFMLRLISFLGVLSTKNKILILFSVLAFLLNSYLTLYQSTMLYMNTIHIPLALSQFYQFYGKKPLQFWFVGTMILFHLNWNVVLEKHLIYCMVSVTMSHMILISFWQK